MMQTKAMYVHMDTNADEYMDVMVFSPKRDGKFTVSLWDTDFDLKWDTMGIHDDGTIKPTSTKPYTP